MDPYGRISVRFVQVLVLGWVHERKLICVFVSSKILLMVIKAQVSSLLYGRLKNGAGSRKL